MAEFGPGQCIRFPNAFTSQYILKYFFPCLAPSKAYNLNSCVNKSIFSCPSPPVPPSIPFSHLPAVKGEGVKDHAAFQIVLSHVCYLSPHTSDAALPLDASTYLSSEAKEMGMIFLNMKCRIKSVGGKYAV